MIPGIPYVKLALFAAGAAIVIGGFLYVKGLQNDVRELSISNGLLKDSVEKQQEVIMKQQEDFKDIRQALKDIDTVSRKLEEDIAKVSTKFNKTNAAGKKRDVGKIAVQKTKRVEKLMNRGTEKAIDCMTKAMNGVTDGC